MLLQSYKQQTKQRVGLNILVVDDDSLNQRLLGIVLMRDNHSITFAHNADEAINAINGGKLDLIFMDIQIPGMDGVELCRYIRNGQSSNRQSPIIALTALSPDHEKLQDILDEGLIDDCIHKPFNTNDIERIIESIQAGGKASLARDEQVAFIDIDDMPVLETTNIFPLFSNDFEKYKRLLGEFSSTLSERINEMRQSEASRDWHSLSILAHNLTGVAANFGAKKLSALAQDLDKEAYKKNTSVTHALLDDIENSIPPLQEAFIRLIRESNNVN